MDMDELLNEGLQLDWERHTPRVNGAVEFHLDYGDWTAIVLFITERGDEDWWVQAWNRKNHRAPSINSVSDGYAGFLTASDAMRFCERWLRKYAK